MLGHATLINRMSCSLYKANLLHKSASCIKQFKSIILKITAEPWSRMPHQIQQNIAETKNRNSALLLKALVFWNHTDITKSSTSYVDLYA